MINLLVQMGNLRCAELHNLSEVQAPSGKDQNGIWFCLTLVCTFNEISPNIDHWPGAFTLIILVIKRVMCKDTIKAALNTQSTRDLVARLSNELAQGGQGLPKSSYHHTHLHL